MLRIAYIVALFVCLGATALVAGSRDSAAGYASIVVDADTGEVLRSRNADTRNYPASLAKMMTLYLTFEALESGRLSLDQTLTISKRAAGQPRSKLGLKRGQKIKVHDAILALIIKSANDVATAVAEAIAKTEIKFAQKMTRKARELGMKRTSFRNASGLPNRRQLSTARDMATLALALQRDFPQYYKYFSTESFTFKKRTYTTYNRLMFRYAGMDGMKTGYIRASGFNLVSSAMRNGRRIVAVVFGGRTSRSRDAHMRKLLNLGFRRVAALDKARNFNLASIPKPRAKPHDPAVTTGLWGIQVGAFVSVTAARQAIEKASKRLPGLLSDTTAALTPIKSEGGDTLYRARLLGLQPQDANKACQTLRALTMPCAIIRGSDDPLKVALVRD
jgi:D-alanyl-D-alanine carboxypeptidase